jgi:hypothetical protein
MYAALTVARYPRGLFPLAILSMAWFRLPLWLDRRNLHWKLMGSGRNGSFDIRPDLDQWAVMVFRESPFPTDLPTGKDRKALDALYGRAIPAWWRFFGCETWTVLLRVVGGHGTWDGKSLAVRPADTPPADAGIAVLTRATIRWRRLRAFWSNVPPVSSQFFRAPGLVLSLGIGEAPFTRQATFSMWRSEADMKAFAYRSAEHREVIARTRKEGWYSEDMFLRFEVLSTIGSLRGRDPWRDDIPA